MQAGGSYGISRVIDGCQRPGRLGRGVGKGPCGRAGAVGQSPASVVALPDGGLPTRRLDHSCPQLTRQLRFPVEYI